MAKEESREKGMIWDLEDFGVEDRTKGLFYVIPKNAWNFLLIY